MFRVHHRATAPPPVAPPCPRRGPGFCRRLGWGGLSLLVWGIALVAPTAAGSEAFRFGFSATIVTDVNESDANAAIKVWGQAVLAEHRIPVASEPVFFRSLGAMIGALRNGQVDAVSLTMPEYYAVRQATATDTVLLGQFGEQCTEEYVVLVHRAAGIDRLEALRGRSILLLQQPRTSLAEPWLDALLLRQSLGTATRFFGRMQNQTKLTKVLLPVFFRQADACVVHRRGFEVMCELNPQLGRELVVLASSPGLVPGLLCFRASFQPPFRAELVRALTGLDRSASGSQLLTLFQSDRIVLANDDALEATIQFVEDHARLRLAAGLPASGPSEVRP